MVLAAPRSSARLIELGRWALYLVLSWIVLRPALLITISSDDFINPFYIYDTYGSNPWRLTTHLARDVFRNGHFNVIGQVFGGFVFASWNYLIAWGVRYSLIYATTKFVVIVGCALAGARLLRTLASLGGWTLDVWRARVVVAAVLLPTLQIHLPWGLDPVGSFPLFGYLPTALGMLALDAAIHALQRDDTRSAIVAAIALCGSILYYELNVAVVVALAPIVVLLRLRRRRIARPVASLLRRSIWITGPPVAMTVGLTIIAARTNTGYTGTELDAGSVTPGLLARAIGGSLPATAWGAAHDWLNGPVGLTALTAVSAAIVGVALVRVAWRPPAPPPASRWWEVLLVASCPVVMWLGATVIQTITSQADTRIVALGYVYTYYAYGSAGVALAVIIAARALPGAGVWRRVRPALLVAALIFVVAQMAVNDTVTRVYQGGWRLNDELLVAVSERPPEAQRCDALRSWVVFTRFPAYYDQAMVNGLNATYRDHFDELFCSADVLNGG